MPPTLLLSCDSVGKGFGARPLFEHLSFGISDGDRVGLIGLPRKQGKSALGSGIALFGLFAEGAGAQVFSCAADKEQARIVFGVAKRMVELQPELSEECKLYRDAIEEALYFAKRLHERRGFAPPVDQGEASGAQCQ